MARTRKRTQEEQDRQAENQRNLGSVEDGGSEAVEAGAVGTPTSKQHDVDVFFVEDKTARQAQTMLYAFKSMTDQNAIPKWITIEQALAINQADSEHIYVVHSFKGKVFDHLVNAKARIVGPLTICRCRFGTDKNAIDGVPRRSLDCPIFSKCMYKLVVCCTGIDSEKKSSLKLMIERMSGIYEKDLHHHVTHLVANSVGSMKYQAAIKHKMTVVTSNWIEDCFNKYQHQLYHANDEEVVNKYKLEIFKGLTICPTQVSQEQREKLKKDVEGNGGKYETSLHQKTNILILKDTAENLSDKVKYAIQWKIPVLSVKWVDDSVNDGHALPFDKYKVEFPGENRRNKMSLGIEVEKISKPPQRVTRQQRISTESSVDGQVLTRFEKDIGMLKLSEPPIKSEEVVSMFEKLKVKRGDSFLDGCTIAVTGFPAAINEVLKPLVQCAGALFQERVYKNVSHVIVGSEIKEEQLRELIASFACKFVTLEWIYDCIQKGEFIDADDFTIDSCLENAEELRRRLAHPNLKRVQKTSELSNDQTPKKKRTKKLTSSQVDTIIKRGEDPDRDPITWEDHDKYPQSSSGGS